MADLDRLYRFALENSNMIKDYRKRFVYDDLKQVLKREGREKDKKQIMLIYGLRGVGKTTLMLQLFTELQNTFYFSADSILVKTETLFNIVEQAYRQGYKTIFIDEIHKYLNWVDEVKNIYDSFDVRIIVSGSSIASIKKGGISLGRRASNLPVLPLTFGEFFYLKQGIRYSAIMGDVLDKKSSMHWLSEHPNVEMHYREYLLTGGFPIKIGQKDTIFKIIKKMIYEDALAEFSLTKNKVDINDKLLGFLSLSKPGEFSYTSFSSISGHAKSSVYEAVHMLKELELIRVLEESGPKSHAKSTIKLLFSHPNLRVAFADQLLSEAEFGALREEYFVFHMSNLSFAVFIPKKLKKTPDYEININSKKILFEIGSGLKSKKQLMGRSGVIISDEQLIVLGFVQETDQKS
ncbi:MAG: AAA family ATPase [Bacteroidota bacterium]|nr:AAA family ATPase [Candidatus Micrarchaeota archaeon]